MNAAYIVSKVDHTLLTQTATEADIKALCDEALRFKVASVCIPPCYVKAAKIYMRAKMPVCTVVGFPNGYTQTAVKIYETQTALDDGADEIDMVININMLKNRSYDLIQNEIAQIKKICDNRILKVIVEACLLTKVEKIKMCGIISEAGADFIKTSTGFSAGGATPEDIALFKKHVAPGVKIKAAGGIQSLEDAENLINLGADRLGSSRIIKLLKQEQTSGYQ